MSRVHGQIPNSAGLDENTIDHDSSGARFAATLAGGVVVVGVIVTAVIVVVLAGGPNTKYTTSGTEEHPAITEKNMRDASGLTMVVPELRTAANNPWIEFLQGLFCTFGAKPNAPLTPEMYSVCEILFYDSLYKKGPTPFDPTHLDPALSIFLGSHPTVYYSDLGIGFAYKNIYEPDILVLLSHYVEGDNTFKDCRVVPPTMLTRPVFPSSNISYRYDLVCKDPSFSVEIHNKSGVYGALYYNQADGRIFTYDSTTAFIEKVG
ncbi:hypothetical protein HPB52_002036 [Rhipicephalus sanguineus]|uniref:Uncharacterized protein n=1 Tax=Rhipicephalus sanguineus TaxID=34632 RepID=A0A9D4PHH9_RHISA|nr:hypothetical protein HPB52_002036 [Rhipicephalus sanguineus]